MAEFPGIGGALGFHSSSYNIYGFTYALISKPTLYVESTGAADVESTFPKEMDREKASSADGTVVMKLLNKKYYGISVVKESNRALGGNNLYFSLDVAEDVTSLDLSTYIVQLIADDANGNSECNTILKVPTNKPSDAALGGALLRVYNTAGQLKTTDNLTLTLLSGPGENVQNGANLLTAATAGQSHLDVYDNSDFSDSSLSGYADTSLWSVISNSQTTVYKAMLNGVEKVFPVTTCGSGLMNTVLF